jgi:hypothetical protein
VERHNLWLLRSPLPSINEDVWRVVCVAALNAMDAGRRCMWVKWKATHQPAATAWQQPITNFFQRTVHGPQPPGVEAVRAARRAVARFYTELQAFVLFHTLVPVRLEELGTDHPFIWVEPSTADEPSRLRLAPHAID